MTTREPGARLVFTYGLTLRPRSTAFCASRPAATITEGFDVFVQLVIAAITTHPSSSVAAGRCATATVARPSTGPPSWVRREIASGSGFGGRVKALVKLFQTFGSGTRSCGRFGPATLGSTCVRSSSRSSVKRGVGAPSTRNSPCSLV